MKNLYVVLIGAALSFLLVRCGDNPPKDTPAANAIYINAGLKARPLTDVKFESTPERIARGKYLTNGASHCFLCHSVRDWSKPGAPPIESMKGAGSLVAEGKGLRVVAPNITPDKETGAGTWTDDMFARAIREGVGHDGRALYPLMLYQEFKKFSDEDIASIVVYLRTLPPVHNELPKSIIPDEVKKGIAHLPRPIYDPVPEPDLSNVLERGKYLTEVGGCIGCHTSWETKLKPGLFAGGLHLEELHDSAFSANLTPDESGLAYDENTFISVIRTGKGGTLHSIMPWIVVKNYTDDDLRAIYRYLHTRKPVRHYINNFSEPTYCAECGQTHGLGNMNTPRVINAVNINPSDYHNYEGTFTSDEGDSMTVFCDGDSLKLRDENDQITVNLLPVSSSEFASDQMLFDVKFNMDKEKKAAALSFNVFDDVVCAKVK